MYRLHPKNINRNSTKLLTLVWTPYGNTEIEPIKELVGQPITALLTEKENVYGKPSSQSSNSLMMTRRLQSQRRGLTNDKNCEKIRETYIFKNTTSLIIKDIDMDSYNSNENKNKNCRMYKTVTKPYYHRRHVYVVMIAALTSTSFVKMTITITTT